MNLRMHCAVAAAAAIVFLAASAAAQDRTPNPFSPVGKLLQAVTGAPDGWTPNLDGSYRHAASGVVCPKRFKSFTLGEVTGPSQENANIVGVCRYRDGEGRNGAIRIRKFVEGWGSDMSTANNDKALMATDGSAPMMLMRSSTDRKTGASRLTVTAVRNGFLVDCSVSQLEHNVPNGDFPAYCTTIPQ